MYRELRGAGQGVRQAGQAIGHLDLVVVGAPAAGSLDQHLDDLITTANATLSDTGTDLPATLASLAASSLHWTPLPSSTASPTRSCRTPEPTCQPNTPP